MNLDDHLPILMKNLEATLIEYEHESDQSKWPGAGKTLEKMTKKQRYDRWACKKNAQELGKHVRSSSYTIRALLDLDDRIRRRAFGDNPMPGGADQAEDDLDVMRRDAERRVADALAKISASVDA